MRAIADEEAFVGKVHDNLDQLIALETAVGSTLSVGLIGAIFSPINGLACIWWIAFSLCVVSLSATSVLYWTAYACYRHCKSFNNLEVAKDEGLQSSDTVETVRQERITKADQEVTRWGKVRMKHKWAFMLAAVSGLLCFAFRALYFFLT